MIASVKNNLDEIIGICRHMQLDSLYLFGSAAREKDFVKTSDIDFLYKFKPGADGMPVSGYDYFDLLFKLEEITGGKVDLIAAEKLSNPYLISSIDEDKIKIYEA
jgi:predicted nucleotidyltransferase